MLSMLCTGALERIDGVTCSMLAKIPPKSLHALTHRLLCAPKELP